MSSSSPSASVRCSSIAADYWASGAMGRAREMTKCCSPGIRVDFSGGCPNIASRRASMRIRRACMTELIPATSFGDATAEDWEGAFHRAYARDIANGGSHVMDLLRSQEHVETSGWPVNAYTHVFLAAQQVHDVAA